MSSEAAIAAQALGKCYQIYARPQDRLLQSLWRGRRQYYREFWALRGLDFEIAKGEAVGVIGRNGSGKSTLMQLVAGTLAPTEGRVETRGRIAALLELGSGFNAEYSGRENVALNAAILGLDAGEIRRRMPEIEAFADIGEFIDQPVKTYSSGMVMRLAFAVSVHVEPEVLVVDEALAVGDVAFQFRCLERLHRLVRSGTTLLFVSHDVGLVKAFCTRALYLKGGRLAAVGPPEEVADLYVQDAREVQKQALASQGTLAAESVPAGASRILGARFLDNGASRSAFAQGEEIRFEVSVELAGELTSPAVSALIQDRRMVGITGKACRLERPGNGGARRATAQFALHAAFEAGTYFVALRLEDRIMSGAFLVLAKQSAVLEFEVLGKGRQDFLGVVDLSMSGRELGAGE